MEEHHKAIADPERVRTIGEARRLSREALSWTGLYVPGKDGEE